MSSFLDWLRSHHRAFTTRLARRRAFPNRSFRRRRICPHLEALEDRLLLSATIIDLGNTTQIAYAINASGEAVGTTVDGTAFLYNGTNTTDLGTLGGSSSAAFGINASGQVVGQVIESDGSTHAFVYNSSNREVNGIPSQQLRDLGTLPSGLFNYTAYGINTSGVVVGQAGVAVAKAQASAVGQAKVSAPTSQAFSESPPYSGTMTQLGPLPAGFDASGANGINDSGQVVGYLQMSNATEHAGLYSNGSWTDLGTLPGDQYSVANAINASGEIVGYSNTSSDGSGTSHAFLYNNGTMTSLGTLPGGTSSIANGINSAGWIVGQASTSGGGEDAFVYKNGTMIDLNTLIPHNSDLGWQLTDAYAINDAGQIVGSGFLNDAPQAFLLNLNPVQLSPGSLSIGVVSIPYTQQIASNGSSTVSITSGALPLGMTATQTTNGLVITGTPRTAGTYTFTVTAEAENPAYSNSQSYTLTIDPQSPSEAVGVSTVSAVSAGTRGQPTLIQAIEGLIFDGAGLAYDLLTHQDTSGIHANIAFDLPYAGPLGQMFLDYSFAVTLNALRQDSQLLLGIQFLSPSSTSQTTSPSPAPSPSPSPAPIPSPSPAPSPSPSPLPG